MSPIPSSDDAQPSEIPKKEEEKHSILHIWASSILFFLVVLISFACLIIWIQVHPKRLRFIVENAAVRGFAISSVSLPDRNTTEYSLHANFSVSFSTRNLNRKVTIRYEAIQMMVECNDQVLAFGPVVPFAQAKGKAYQFNLTLSAQNVTLSSPAANYLNMIKKPLDQVKVDVKMSAKASFVVPHWKTDHRKLKIACLGIMLHFSASTPFEKKKCKVEL